MKHHVLISGVALTIFVAGCAPRLAQTPLSDKEAEWQRFIKQHYPEWRPPQTIPPSVVLHDREADREVSPRRQAQPALIEDDSFKIEPLTAPLPLAPTEKAEPFQAPPVPAEATDGRSYETYTVQKNDTLWTIAEKFYQKGSQWPRIQEANPGLGDAKRLRVGTKLRIPLP